MTVAEQTHNFYDNQELAFAPDFELKAVTQKFIELEKQHKKLKFNYEAEVK